MQDEYPKKIFITKQDLENNRNKTIDKNQEKDKYQKLSKFTPSKFNKIISINFPLISKLPHQIEFTSNYDSIKLIPDIIHPKKIKTSRKDSFQKIIFKNKKFPLKKRYITNPDTKLNSNINIYTNINTNLNSNINNESNSIENISKKEKCKSNFDSVISRKIHCITIDKQLLKSSKLNLKESYLITNIPTNSHSKLIENKNCSRNNILIYESKRMQSAKSNKSLNKNCLYSKNKNYKYNGKNYLNSENYLNSDFIKELLAKRKPYLEPISLDQFSNRLLQSQKKKKSCRNSISMLPDYIKNSESKKVNLITEKIKEKSKENLRYSKESKSYDIKSLNIINKKLTNDELLEMYRKKKLQKCDFLIEKTSKKLNKIKSNINKDYSMLIKSFNNYDDWYSTKNDEMYD